MRKTSDELKAEKNLLKRDIKLKNRISRSLLIDNQTKKEIMANLYERMQTNQLEMQSRRYQRAELEAVVEKLKLKTINQQQLVGTSSIKKVGNPLILHEKLIIEQLDAQLIDRILYFAKSEVADEQNGSKYKLCKLFINKIVIQYYPAKNDEIRLKKKGNPVDEYGHYKQAFIISHTTKIKDLKRVACQFWGSDESKLELYEEGNHNMEMHYNLTVNTYFHNTTTGHRYKPRLFLQKPNPDQPNLPNYDDESRPHLKEKVPIKHEKESESKLDTQCERKDKEQPPDILSTFRGFIKYKRIEYKQAKIKKEIIKDQTNICTFCISLLLLIFTIIFLTYWRNIGNSYWITKGLRTGLNTPYRLKYGENTESMEVPVFKNINSPSDVFDFLYYVGGALFPREEASRAPTDRIIGPIRIMQMRTKSKECIDNKSPYKCYHMDYNSDTQETEHIGNGEESWRTFRTKEENGMSVLRGKVGTYDGSGYVQDFYVPGDSKETYLATLRQYKNSSSGYFSPAVRAIYLTSTIYYLSMNAWVTISILFEQTSSGVIVPASLTTRPFQPNMIESDVERMLMAMAIVRLVLGFNFILTTFKLIYGNWPIRNLLNIAVFYHIAKNIFLFSLFLTNIILLITHSNKSTQDYLNEHDQFNNFENKNEKYELIFILEAVMCLLLTTKVISVFRLNTYMNLLLSAQAIAAEKMAAYLIVLVPGLTGFTIMGMNIWSYYLLEYNALAEAVIATLKFTVGHANIAEMLSIYSTPGLIYIIFFSIFVIYAMLSVIMGIYADSYRKMLTEIGYPDDQLETVHWTAKDFIFWICGCLPNVCLSKVKKAMEDVGNKEKLSVLEDNDDYNGEEDFPTSARLE